MNKIRWVLLLVLGMALTTLLPIPSASADSTTTVAFDSYTKEFNQSQNNATATSLLVSNNAGFRKYAFVQVSVPSVPAGETLSNAYLRVYLTGTIPSGATLTADRVANNWTETGVTWASSPALVSSAPSTVTAVAGWNNIPINTTPGTTQSYRVRTTFTSSTDLNISSQENANGNGPRVLLDTIVAPVTNPSATRASTTCGVVDVDYATGPNDNQSSTFVTTVDGTQVDNEVVSAPNGTGGYTATLTEDSSGGSADVVVTANGTQVLAFSVNTNCAEPPATWPPTSPISPKLVGMSAREDLWDSRLAEVGACNVTARRIFVTDAATDWDNKKPVVQEALAAGMTPVISFKSPVASFTSGSLDSVYTAIRSDLIAMSGNVATTFWHEPHGDMTSAQFQQASQRFFTLMDAPNIAVGPILNGWLLDNQVSTFASYTSPTLLSQWEYVGVDSYHSSPGSSKLPGRALYQVETWLDGQGLRASNLPLILGEYNGFDAAAIAYAGEAILSIPEVWIGLVWNSTGDTYTPLQGDRITAYQNTKNDSRAKHTC